MDRKQTDALVGRFISALMVAEERIPLDRAMASNLETFGTLRDAGLTWTSISALLTHAGARRQDGRTISPDQLRASYGRLNKRSEIREVSKVARPGLEERRYRTPAKMMSKPAPLAQPPPSTNRTNKDVSDAEIAAALARIQKM